MLLWPVVIVSALGAVAILVPGCSTDKVMVPKTALPALHEITPSNLEEVEMDGRSVDDSHWIESGDLVGRVTKTAIAKGELVRKADVTAAKPEGYGTLTSVAFRADSSTAGDLTTGKKASLLFAPIADAEAVKPLEVDAIVISANDGESGETDYVVAVTQADRTRMLDVVARARLLVVPGE